MSSLEDLQAKIIDLEEDNERLREICRDADAQIKYLSESYRKMQGLYYQALDLLHSVLHDKETPSKS